MSTIATQISSNAHNPVLSMTVLQDQNKRYMNTGGRSQENHSEGFRPAFSDTSTGVVYPSCFADGRLAPMHLLDGLPKDVVLERTTSGRVIAVKDSIVAGFIRAGQFYTRAEAAAAITTH